MDEKLPEAVDVVILGTGLPESMLAAVCSKNGLSVLTIDRNSFYGSSWGSFSFESLKKWLTSEDDKISSKDIDVSLEEGEIYIPLTNKYTKDGICNVSFNIVENKQEDETTNLEKLQKNSRKFSIDLCPKLLLSDGKMVSTLCDSEVSKYVEFVNAERLLCLKKVTKDVESYKEYITKVPCSKADVFKTTSITMLEKRILMKFMTEVLNWHFHREEHEWKDVLEGDFDELLEKQKIGGQLKEYVMDLIAILREISIGKYGNSPFLYPLYGVGELPQGFSRLSAVYGGTFCLDNNIDGFVIKDNKIIFVVTGGQKIKCKTVICNGGYIPDKYFNKDNVETMVERIIIISNKPITKFDSEESETKVGIVNLASINDGVRCCLIETGYHGQTAPKGYYVSHITSDKFSDEFINESLDKLYINSEDKTSSIMMKIRFSIKKIDELIDLDKLPTNVYVTPTTDSELNFRNIILKCDYLSQSILEDK
ncbi:GDP dissociation inhibitor [Strongyloides ratti]|uniref:GDP dissociation inhibitor n=1 Tax=Strongyloides ratti TaxID=34506 RepID=A0A090LBG0_STRRB|nr:GDP dissociation inhibitor [Strongyloides ratti]CEF64855.1 GDP dissociation inhibitor [Strongyloides ratti]